MTDSGGPQAEDQTQHEFYWSAEAEPHSQRRREILAKYGPQVRALYGYDNRTAVQVAAVTLFQMAMCYVVKDFSWGWIFGLGWVISGFANQNLFCAQHELSHFLAFKKPLYNKVLSMLSNTVLVVPTATTFRKYHQEHHSHLGVEGWDVDLPTYLEANVITTTAIKVAWVFCYILVYGLRPVIVRPKTVGTADLVNMAVVLGFDAAVLYLCGFKALMYLALGTVMGGGMHPMAGHLISEHYMFIKGQETYSYYGPMNALTYNVGFHNEHHDFPQIPHTRLHKLKNIAPEFYTTLKYHTSWIYVIWAFLTDTDVGPWTRMKRKAPTGTPADAPVMATATAKSAGKDALLNCQAAAALRERDPNVPIGGDALAERKTQWAAKKLP